MLTADLIQETFGANKKLLDTLLKPIIKELPFPFSFSYDLEKGQWEVKVEPKGRIKIIWRFENLKFLPREVIIGNLTVRSGTWEVSQGYDDDGNVKEKVNYNIARTNIRDWEGLSIYLPANISHDGDLHVFGFELTKSNRILDLRYIDDVLNFVDTNDEVLVQSFLEAFPNFKRSARHGRPVLIPM
ncbi:MAG: hypothetical protein ACYCQJ_13760 [Nitrososphaerales archaeon]